MMGKFKVGDKVRLTEQYGRHQIGTEGVVNDVLGGGDDDDLIYTDTVSGVYARRLELVPTWQPKVGDRVVWREEFKSSLYTKGKTYEIKAFEHPNLILTDDADSPRHTWTAETIIDNFDLAPATLTIEAGKFYKTRDGRKVGPMEDYSGAPGEDLSLAQVGRFDKLFNRDGTHHYKDSNLDLIAEWVDEPVVATVANDNAVPAKFKVGDRVRALVDWGSIKKGQIYTVPYLDEDGEVWLTSDGVGGWNDYLTNSELELASAPATPTPTPTAIVALIEDGQPKPNTRPYVHATEEAAKREADRLASIHKGQQFGVYILTTTSKEAAPTYKHEWQRLAAKGEKINAIKELRSITGLGLKPTKDAVEYWLENEEPRSRIAA